MSNDDEDDRISVSLDVMQWAEVCSALRAYVKDPDMKGAKASRRDALYALREIDRVMMGKAELPPPDEVLREPGQ